MGQTFLQIAERKCKMFVFRTSQYLTEKPARVHIRSCNQQLDGQTDIFVILLRNLFAAFLHLLYCQQRKKSGVRWRLSNPGSEN